MTDEEIVDIVDEDGNELRQASKLKAHKHGWLHTTAIGCLRDGDDCILVRQAPHKQDVGQFVAPVGGHISAGETSVEGLLREAGEEIGARSITYKHVGTSRFHRQVIGRDENHLFHVYEITTEDPITLNDEAVEVKRFNKEMLKRELAQNPQNFGDSFYFILEKYYPEYLSPSRQNRWT